MIRKLLLPTVAAALAIVTAGCTNSYVPPVAPTTPTPPVSNLSTLGSPATPIKYVVVIFGENISYDHYFGTYPKVAYSAANALNANENDQTNFVLSGTAQANNNLVTPLVPGTSTAIANPTLLTANPNGPGGSGAAFNGANAVQPFLLWNTQALTGDMGHSPKPEQIAYDNGAMDQFPGSTGADQLVPLTVSNDITADLSSKGQVMGYFDGTTVTAMWNYANTYAMNDNTYTSQFGPSTPGAINLISGQTNGFAATLNVIPGVTGVTTGGCTVPTGSSPTVCTQASGNVVPDGNGNWTLVGDEDPLYDVCSTGTTQVQMAGKNIGDLLNAKKITWGWFEGGFNLTATPNANGSYGCNRYTTPNPGIYNTANVQNPYEVDPDYIQHHQPFQYYASTANPTHARPSSVASIGNSYEIDGATPEPANHQYDTSDFMAALAVNNIPAVSFLKAPGFEDGHPGYSDPTDEQAFIVKTVNALQASPLWANMLVIITYDDSDGWYDHQMPPIVNPSTSTLVDFLSNPAGGSCTGTTGAASQQGITTPATALLGTAGVPVLGRCGYGTRIPFLVISPYSKKNYVDHTLLDQSSVIRFIEDNWLGGTRVQPGGSFDTIAGSIENMLTTPTTTPNEVPVKPNTLILDPSTGAPIFRSLSAAE